MQLSSIDNLMGGGSEQSTGRSDRPLDPGRRHVHRRRRQPRRRGPETGRIHRAGNFTFNSQGYLTTESGEYVLGKEKPGAGVPDSYIKVPPGSTDISIGQDGSVSYIAEGSEERQIAGYVSIARFQKRGRPRTDHRQQLGRKLGLRQSRRRHPGRQFGLTISGTLEMSNVELATEFTNMIDAQRGFEANSRTITTADEMLQDLVNLKR